MDRGCRHGIDRRRLGCKAEANHLPTQSGSFRTHQADGRAECNSKGNDRARDVYESCLISTRKRLREVSLLNSKYIATRLRQFNR